MRRSSLLLLIVLAGMLATAPHHAQAAPISPGISITIRPLELVPAQAGFVFVGGAYPLDVTVSLDAQPLNVYWAGGGYLTPFAFPYEEPPGQHQLIVLVSNPATGERLERIETIRVREYTYPDEYVALAFRLTPLLDPQLNQQEVDRLATIYAPHTQPIRWTWPFTIPAPGSVVTSRFGGNRSYNGGVWKSYHSGTDFRAGLDDLVLAAASGRVAASEFFDVRGNVVIIDHGYGIFSQYAHMSQINVAPGQFVQRGQVIGLAGATGRTNGPHLHFEIIVNGIPVDPIRWLALNPSFVPPREVRPEERDLTPVPGEENTAPPPEGEAPQPPVETPPPESSAVGED